MNIDSRINDFFAPISAKAFEILLYSVNIGGVDVRLLLVWLLAAALFFTFYLGFVNIRYFGHAWAVALGRFDRDQDAGQISSWQALMASMSGTVGLGNIAGVAVAVSLGGPGAVFWMVVMGFLSMSTKFAEVTLGMHYRRERPGEPGKMAGGPMYYLQDGIAELGAPLLGKIVAMVFAFCMLLGGISGGVMFQANQSFEQFVNVTGGEASYWVDKGWIFGAIIAVLVGVVIIGGIKSIAAVAARLVPFMAVIYVAAALVVIGLHFDHVFGAFGIIFKEAFSAQAGIAGVVASMLVGIQRGTFSNESGLGTAPILYAAAKSDHPVRQGMASILGPFIDTVVICSVTALLIVVSGVYQEADGISGVQLTSNAFESGISWFPYVLALSVILFAYSTMISFAYMATRCFAFLITEDDRAEIGFKIFYCFAAVLGAAVSLPNVIDFMDAFFLSMAIPNIIGLYLLAPTVKRLLVEYKEKYLSTGG